MKRSIPFPSSAFAALAVFAMLAALAAAGCAKSASSHADATVTTARPAAEIYLPGEDNAPHFMKITGMVETNGTDGVYVVANWTSRSRKSYTVTGAKKAEVSELAGNVVTVSGTGRMFGMWSGTIEVETIER